MTIYVCLDKANLNAINISTPDFCIWQHFCSNWTTTHLQKLADVPEIPVVHLYMMDQGEPTVLVEINRNTGRTLFYIEALGTPRDLHRDNEYGFHYLHRSLLH